MTWWYVVLAVVAIAVAARVSLWYVRAFVEWIEQPRPERVLRAMRARLQLDQLRGDR